jgi:hypothetical protein
MNSVNWTNWKKNVFSDSRPEKKTMFSTPCLAFDFSVMLW